MLPLDSGLFDRLNDRPHRVDHRIERAGDAIIELNLAIPQSAKEVLTAMRQGAEFGEAEEAAVALDRVHRAKNARQPLGIVGAFLKRDQVAVELIEVLA